MKIKELAKEIRRRFKEGKRFSQLITKRAIWHFKVRYENDDIYLLALLKDDQYGYIIVDLVWNWVDKVLGGGFYRVPENCLNLVKENPENILYIRNGEPIVEIEVSKNGHKE